jgi:RES domain-containing protein
MDSARISRLPVRTIQGIFYRAVPAAAVGYALEDGPSYRFRNRYNVVDRFGALYFADRMEVCRATLEKRGLLGSRALPHILLSFEIDVKSILDLTEPSAWKTLGIERQDLVRSVEQPDAYQTTHRIAELAYAAGRAGLQAPDATETGQTLVLYPARLVAGTMIRLKGDHPF